MTLVPDKYHISNDGEEVDLAFYYKDDLLNLDSYAEKLVIYLTPVVLNTHVNIITYNFGITYNIDTTTFKSSYDSEETDIENIVATDENSITLLLRNIHYDIGYSNNFTNLFKNELQSFCFVGIEDKKILKVLSSDIVKIYGHESTNIDFNNLQDENIEKQDNTKLKNEKIAETKLKPFYNDIDNSKFNNDKSIHIGIDVNGKNKEKDSKITCIECRNILKFKNLNSSIDTMTKNKDNKINCNVSERITKLINSLLEKRNFSENTEFSVCTLCLKNQIDENINSFVLNNDKLVINKDCEDYLLEYLQIIKFEINMSFITKIESSEQLNETNQNIQIKQIFDLSDVLCLLFIFEMDLNFVDRFLSVLKNRCMICNTKNTVSEKYCFFSCNCEICSDKCFQQLISQISQNKKNEKVNSNEEKFGYCLCNVFNSFSRLNDYFKEIAVFELSNQSSYTNQINEVEDITTFIEESSKKCFFCLETCNKDEMTSINIKLNKNEITTKNGFKVNINEIFHVACDDCYFNNITSNRKCSHCKIIHNI